MTLSFEAKQRARLNSSGLRNLRKSGRLPGIVFGRNADNEMVHVSTVQIQKWLNQGATGVVELQIDGGNALSVLLEDVQRDPVTRELMHVDFQRVQKDVVVRTKLPIKFKGTPVGTKQGGIVQVQSGFVEVETLPGHLPTELEIDISNLNIGDSIFVKDVELAEEVTVVSEPHEFLLSVVK